jgi:hypothetical protein
MPPARPPLSLSLPFTASSSSLCAPLSLASRLSLTALSRVTAPRGSLLMLHAAACPSSIGHPSSCCTGTLRTPSTLLAAAHSACAAPADTSCTSYARHAHWLRSVTRSTQPPSATAARSTPPHSPRSRFSPLAAVAPEPARASQLQVHLRLELLLFWLLLHLIMQQQPSVCRGALLRCGFVAAFVFAAVHRAATSLPVSIISICIFCACGRGRCGPCQRV